MDFGQTGLNTAKRSINIELRDQLPGYLCRHNTYFRKRMKFEIAKKST